MQPWYGEPRLLFLCVLGKAADGTQEVWGQVACGREWSLYTRERDGFMRRSVQWDKNEKNVCTARKMWYTILIGRKYI